MKLIIGGCAQGKLHYALQKYGKENCVVWDGAMPEEPSAGKENGAEKKLTVLNHFQHWVRQSVLVGGNPEKAVWEFVEKYPDCIIISDEIGNGIVPMDAFEREYRERTGRILVELAGQAEEVERVICGIGQKIK